MSEGMLTCIDQLLVAWQRYFSGSETCPAYGRQVDVCSPGLTVPITVNNDVRVSARSGQGHDRQIQRGYNVGWFNTNQAKDDNIQPIVRVHVI